MSMFARALLLVYYCFFFGKQTRIATSFGRLIGRWERGSDRGDIPAAAEKWESQYTSGDWEYMEEALEFARYSAVAGYIHYLKPTGAILDVGCGTGILLRRFLHSDYAQYVGIDISDTALGKLAAYRSERNTFLKADAEAYTPARAYDVIVFNETLYYFHDPLTSFQKYAGFLNDKGIIVVSTSAVSRRASAVLSALKARWRAVDEETITRGSRSWVVTVFTRA